MSEHESPLPAARHTPGMAPAGASASGARSQPIAPVTPATPVAPRANVELHIEELVLHGFPAGARHTIGDAVRRELARLLAEGGISPTLTSAGKVPRVDGGAFQMAPDATPDAIGARVAQAIHGGLRR